MKKILLKEIYLDNFKSFKDSKFEFGKLNCLVAPNNVGKSNLILALNFLNSILYDNPMQAISKLDLNNIKNYHYNEKTIKLNAKFEIENIALVGNSLIRYENELLVLFSVDLDTHFYNFDVIINGKLKFIDVDKFDLLNNLGHFDLKIYNDFIEHNLNNYDGYLNLLNKKRFSSFKLNYNQSTNSCIIESNNTTKNMVQKLFALIFAKDELVSVFNFKHIFNNLSLFYSFYFDTNEVKKPEITGNKELLTNGKNLVEVLDFINKNKNDIFEDISCSLIGEVEMINGLNIDNSSFVPLLKFQEEIGENVHDIDIWNVSDGTIHFIAIMTAILGSTNPVSILIEEPERHMHMKVLSYIIETMRDDDKQIFFTTHSGELLKVLNQNEIIFLYRDEDTGDTKGLSASKIKSLNKIFTQHKYELSDIIKNEVLGYIGDYDG